MKPWLDREDVLKRLGIRPQTLYAYVSRHKITVRPDPADARRSQYLAADVEAHADRRVRVRRPAQVAEGAIDWGEPVLKSAITSISRGQLLYRGHDAASLSRTEPFEVVARWLWGEATPDATPFLSESGPGRPGESHVSRILCDLLIEQHRRQSTGGSRVGPQDANRLMGAVLRRMTGIDSPMAAEDAFGRAWNCFGGRDILRQALVLSADHELNASTFAARLATSTGAPLPAVLLAACSTLLGPAHGGVTPSMQVLVRLARRLGPVAAIQRWQASPRAGPVPGFGHRLYPEGDPRAACLLEGFRLPDLFRDLIRAGEDQLGARANFDLGLAAALDSLDQPASRAFELFTFGRMAGWLAHALEQARTGQLIRPRARYVGPPPSDDAITLTPRIVLGGALD